MRRLLKLIAVIAIIAFALTACDATPVNVPQGNVGVEAQTASPGSQTGRSASGGPTDEPAIDLGFTVYYIDVGQADAALIVCDGETMLIDGGNASDSSLIYSFLERHGITHLDYIVGTHAHEDHIGGLAGALNYATVGVAFCPVTEYDSRVFGNFVKYLGERDVSITVPNHGDSFMLGSADVKIVGPTRDHREPNNTSIVLKITYGSTSFLFTGDAERPAEQDILEAGHDISATVLKVGHHGSDTATTYPFLREIMPQYAVISCGTDNIYGHPTEDALSRLRDADVTVFRTDMQGTIICVSDGETVSITTDRNATAQTNPTEREAETVDALEEYYIGNSNTHKFHRPDCSGLPNENNRVVLETRDAAISGGFESCGICKP